MADYKLMGDVERGDSSQEDMEREVSRLSSASFSIQSDYEDANDDSLRRARQYQSRRRYGMIAGLFALVVVVGVSIYVAVPHSSSEQPVEHDNKMTQRLYQSLNSAKDSSGKLLFNASTLGSSGSGFLLETLSSKSLVLSGASVSLVTPAHQAKGTTRNKVQVTGQATVLGHPSTVSSTVHYHNGQLAMEVKATPNDASPRPLTSVLPSGQIPQIYDQVMVQNTSYHACNEIAPSCPHKGLQFHSIYNLTMQTMDSFPLVPVLKKLEQMVEQQAIADGKAALLAIKGSLKPTLNLTAGGNGTAGSGVAPSGASSGGSPVYHFGKYVGVTDVKFRLAPWTSNAKEVSAQGLLMVTPPGVDMFNVTLNGTLDLTDHRFTVTGTHSSDWTIPGKVKGLDLNSLFANITVYYGSSSTSIPRLSGSVSGTVAYGQVTAGLDIPLPISLKAGSQYAIVATIEKDFPLHNMPSAIFLKYYPRLTSIKTALLFAPGTGTFEFPASLSAVAPAKSVQVVRGLNLVGLVDLDQTYDLSGLPANHTSDPQPKVVFAGSVSTSGDFRLSSSLTNLELNSHVTLQSLNVSVGNKQPYLRVATGVKVDDRAISTQPLYFTLSGTVNATAMVVSGAMHTTSTWSFHLASRAVTAQPSSVSFWLAHVKEGKAPAKLSGSISAVAVIDKAHLQFTVSYPDPANQQNCVYFTADEWTESNPNLALLLAQTVPAQAPTFTDVPASAVSGFLNSTLTRLQVRWAPACGDFSLSAAVNTKEFGFASLGLIIHNASQWRFSAFIQPAAAWNLLSSGLVSRGFPAIKLTGVTLVLSNHDDTITLPLQIGGGTAQVSMDTKQGLNVRATLPLGQTSTGHVRILQHLYPNTTELVLTGQLSKTNFDLSAALDRQQGVGLHLGHNIQLYGANVSLFDHNMGSTGPSHVFGLSLGASAVVPNRFASHDRVEFDVFGELETGEALLRGDVHDANASLSIPLGVTHLTMQSLEVELALTWGSGQPAVAEGNMTGIVSVGSAHIAVGIDLTKTDLRVSGQVTERPPLTVGDLARKVCGSHILSGLPLPASLSNDIQHVWAFEEASVAFQVNPPSINGTGAMRLFGLADLRAALHLYNSIESAWEFTLGLELGSGVQFSSIIPTIKELDRFPFASVAVAVASRADTINFPSLATPYEVDRGFNFLASLNLNSSKGLRTIAKIVHVEEALVKATINDETGFTLHADLVGNVNLWHKIDVTAGGLILRVMPPNVQVGAEISLIIQVTKRPTDALHFTGDFLVGDLGLEFDAAMTNNWVNPLGIHGLTIERCAISLGISWELVPYKVGLAGGLLIGDVGGDAGVYITETQELVYGGVQNINLQKIVDNLLDDVGVHSPPHLVQVITDISLKNASFYVNLGAHPVSYNGRTYPGGFMFEISELNLWNVIKGSAEVMIGTSRLLVNANLAPIHLLDNLISITGAHGPNTPAKLYLDLRASQVYMSTVNISGAVDLFGNSLTTAITISDTEFSLYIDLSVIDHLLNFELYAASFGSVSDPIDFNVTSALSNRLQDYIATEVPKEMNHTRTDADSHLNAVRADLNQKLADLNGLQQQINALKAKESQAFSAAELKLRDAQRKVADAQNHVNSLENQIHDLEDKIHHLKWYDKWKAVGYGIAIAGLKTAQVTADGALDIAKGVLHLAEDAVKDAPNFDPEILAKEAELGVKRAAYDAAKAVVDGAEKVVNGVTTIVSDVAKWQGELFNIEELSLTGSLKAMKQGNLAYVHVKGKFVGHSVDVTVDIDVADVDSYVHSIWHAIVKLFT